MQKKVFSTLKSGTQSGEAVSDSEGSKPEVAPPASFQQPIIQVIHDRPVLIRPTTPLQWKQSCIGITKVQINPAIKDWMDYDLAFSNWVNTCIAIHADNSRLETICQIPDQWRDEIGESITIVSANCVPGRNRGDTHEAKEGVIHVMA